MDPYFKAKSPVTRKLLKIFFLFFFFERMSALLYSQLLYSGEELSLLIIRVSVQIETQQLFSLGVYSKIKSNRTLIFHF